MILRPKKEQKLHHVITNAYYFLFIKGDIDDCIVTPTVQGQFTPLPEALCDVIMDLTSQGHSATMENMKVKLSIRFVKF